MMASMCPHPFFARMLSY